MDPLTGKSNVRTASAVPNAGGTMPVVKPSAAAAGASNVQAVASGPLVTVLVSNQTSSTSFMDCLVFFSLAHRRGQLSSLYFLPMDTSEWSLLMWLLHAIFLSPLQLSAQNVERVLARDSDCSFVVFPEATPSWDAVMTVPTVGGANSSNANELVHVSPPSLSHSFLQLLLSCATGLAAPGSGSSRRTRSPRRMSIVEVTVAFCGSVQAELQQKHQEELAYATGSGALDEEEEAEFEKLANGEHEEDAGNGDDDGYSAETIKNYAHGRITTRARGKIVPNIPVFWAAAPLRQMRSLSPSTGGLSPDDPNGMGGSGITAIPRPRVVPGFYAFLSGNAPTTIHVLLNQHDDEYVRRRVLQLRGAAANASGSSSEKSPREPHLSELDESVGGAVALRLSAGASVTAWLQQRFMHQEVQLSLFSIHSRFHALPASLSASSIPVSAPLESYAVPISSIKAAGFLAAAWCWIVALTVGFRNARAAFFA
jgi:hypothetical protein